MPCKIGGHALQIPFLMGYKLEQLPLEALDKFETDFASPQVPSAASVECIFRWCNLLSHVFLEPKIGSIRSCCP